MSKKLLAIAGCSIIAVVAFGALFAHIFSEEFDTDQKLTLASEWLDEGRWDLASQIAEEVEESIDTETNSRWHYVVGVSKLLPIQNDLDSVENRRTLMDATEHLNTSREIGFPAGLKGKGQYYLGFCRFHIYQWDKAIEALNDAYQSYPQCRSLALQMAFRAQLRKPKPDLEAAAKTLSRWESIPGKSATEQAQITLGHGQLAFKKKQYAESLSWIEKIPPNLPQSSEGRVLQSMCNLELARTETNQDTRKALLASTQITLKKLVFAAETPAEARRQSSYLLGRVFRLQNNLVDAAGALTIVRQQNPSSAEAIAAGLEEAEILTELGQYEESKVTILNLLRGIQDVSLYNDYWMTLDELRSRLVAIGEQLRKRTEFTRSIELAELLASVFQPAYSLRLQAAAFSEWANSVLKSDQTQQSAERLRLFGKAGETFERLAIVEMKSDDYLNIVWSAAENYEKANQIDSANRMLKTYLSYETRSRQPRGLVAIGKNLIGRGDWQASTEPLQRCLDYYPQSPSCYEVRLLLARAKAELDDLDSAIELLSENLWDHDLSPESPIWQDSSIELGTLIFQRGNRLLTSLKNKPPKDWESYSTGLQASHNDLLRGIDQLSQAVAQFPRDPRYFHTRYLLAHSYRLAAEMPKIIAANDSSILDSAKRQQNQKWRKLMESSVDEFRGLLASVQNAAELDSLAPAILRNCYFGEADALLALGRYEDALIAYKNAAGYYVNQPEALEALVQVAECHKKMGRTKEAQKALRQAEQVLLRIPPDHDARFVSSTRGDRRHWQDLLGWMNKQYN